MFLGSKVRKRDEAVGGVCLLWFLSYGLSYVERSRRCSSIKFSSEKIRDTSIQWSSVHRDVNDPVWLIPAGCD